jgi:hypothetical protein
MLGPQKSVVEVVHVHGLAIVSHAQQRESLCYVCAMHTTSEARGCPAILHCQLYVQSYTNLQRQIIPPSPSMSSRTRRCFLLLLRLAALATFPFAFWVACALSCCPKKTGPWQPQQQDIQWPLFGWYECMLNHLWRHVHAQSSELAQHMLTLLNLLFTVGPWDVSHLQ